MSEEKKHTSQKNKKHHSKKHKQGYAVLPYIVTPIIFVLISLIIVLPMSKIVLNKAVNTVHKAQQTLCIDYNDVIIREKDYSVGDSGKIPKLYPANRVGTVIGESFGLNAKVYYDVNRVSLRGGAACSRNSALPGQSKEIDVFGYATTSFKSLVNAQKGDIIKFETSWGVYEYKVVSNTVEKEKPVAAGEMLVLSCVESNEPFSNQTDNKRYVLAELVSGNPAEEVAK